MKKTFYLLAFLFSAGATGSHAEGLLQLFNVSYNEIAAKMPELAEAGYGSLWLPPPTKGSGGLSVGYDMWDPFDFGNRDQRDTVRTRYGTEAELINMMATAHRFGIRVYFDNIMNHRAFDIPGFNETTPTGGEGQDELYPGMVPEDFHLRKTEDGFYRKWDNTRDWGSAWQVQNLGLSDLIDIAHETPNANHGSNEGDTHPKYSFVRDLNRPEQYDTDKDGNRIYFGWLIDQARADLGVDTPYEELRQYASAYILSNRTAYVEDVGAYLVRAVRWKIDRLKADGLRLDAVKHVPDYFFGQMSGADKDFSGLGYLGAVQEQFNRTRGFSDGNHRDSVFNEKKGRDDAMLFGEHLGEPPGYGGYVDAGMRLVDNDLRSTLNGNLGSPWGTLAGLDQPGAGGFSAAVGVTHANSHDNDYAAMKEMQHAHYMFREGIGLIYSDGYYKAGTLGESGGAFPRHANTQFLGQFADPRIPNILKIHNDFARGLQEGRWGDSDYMAYERRDNRNPFGDSISGSAADEITMVAMFNDNTADGQARPITTSFPSDAYLYQYAEGPNGSFMGGFYKYANELGGVVVPPGGYYVFSWRTPELSTLWPNAAITLYQNGEEVPRITVTRRDGPDGDINFNPYGLSNRGYPEGVTPADYSYQTTVPIVKAGPVTFLARADGSAENIRLKLGGGVDLNGTPTTDPGRRDYPPGIYSDIWMGYEQPFYVDRQHPEKFAAVDTTRCQIGSPGAETYVKTIGGGVVINNGPTGANNYGTDGGNVGSWIYHDPGDTVGGPAGTNGVGDFQFNEGATSIVIWAKADQVSDGFKMFVYYTLDGSFPEGAGGLGRGTTQSAELNWRHDQTAGDTGAWWGSAHIEKPAGGTAFSYKIGLYRQGAPSWWPGNAESVAYKKNMLTTFRVQDFDPATVEFFPHNDFARVPTLGEPYENWPWATQTGLSEGFHVIRARAYLPNGQGGRSIDATPLYNTFAQVFYYDAATPTGEVLYPAANGDTVGGSSYELVIRTDMTVEEVWFHIADSDSGNDDAVTGVLNGNGTGFEPFEDANQNGVRDAGEEFTDVNANNAYDASLSNSWSLANQVTTINLPGQKEWRLRYNNIPSTGSASITIRLHEASSARDIDLDAATAHVTELIRTVETRGPDQRVNIAWPQRDGDTVDDNYTMKVLFTKSLADGTTTETLKERFNFSIASTESGTNRNAVDQSRDNFSINYDVDGTYHELAIPLPNMYNDVPDFLHTLTVTYTFPDNRKLDALRLVKANPSTKPFVQITRPTEFGSDGRPTEIILPDVPGPDTLDYVVRVETSTNVNDLVLSGVPAITVFNEPFTDSNANGVWDAAESYTDANTNGVYDPGEDFFDVNTNGVRDVAEPFTDSNANGTRDGVNVSVSGRIKTWDFTWRITNAVTYQLKATATLNGEITDAYRNARVILRQITDTDEIQDNDDDDDGLLDINETNKQDLPETNAETWSNGDVHIWYASGRSLPNSPDSDGDLLPDGLEVGWRLSEDPPTTPGVDTNDDGIPNFIGDLDPPFYAVVANNGRVPGVGSLNQGDDRARQAAGSVTDPANPDTDNDGILDGIEDANRNGWVDGDGESIDPTWEPWLERAWPNNIMEAGESWTETSPTKSDSDEDGLSDGFGEDKNFNGFIDGDTNFNRTYDVGELWTETNPLDPDTDGDGLPDGWESQYSLDPLDDGTTSLRTGGAGNPDNGASGDPDGDGITNAQELIAGTNPRVDDTIPPVVGEGSIDIGSFTQWSHEDLMVLDEYNEGNSNGGADVYRSWNDTDNSRDIVAFSFRDGGEVGSGGDGRLYFRIDFVDLEPYAEEGEVDAYIVIDTGNPEAGERSIPNSIDIATDMRWEAVIAVYAQNFGSIFVDENPLVNTTTQTQNPVAEGGVVARAFGGRNEAAWNSIYDAVEIAIERSHILDAGWLGDPDTLHFQVFTTKPNTETGGSGDISGRNDIRDTIYDDWLASDWWRDQDNIILNGKLSGYFGRNAANDRGRSAKVMLLAHGNQAIQPGSFTQNQIHNGGDPALGYYRLLNIHETYPAPLTLHITPTFASALQWAANPTPGALNDGPTFNARIANMVASNRIDLMGSTFADHVVKYYPQQFNNDNVALATSFLDDIYGDGAPVTSRKIFWSSERVLDETSLEQISNMGFTYTFADQMRHLNKWFGRTAALSTSGFQINEVNGMKIIPIHDFTSGYLDQSRDQGATLSVRQLLSRRARSGVQNQVVVLWRDFSDFMSQTLADNYEANVRWLASRPWIRVVTAQQIVDEEITYIGEDSNPYANWGSVQRGFGLSLETSAKDWVDWASGENYDNWFNKLHYDYSFAATNIFGRVGVEGHANTAWQAAQNATSPALRDLARAVMGSANFQTAFHFPNDGTDLRKFSTGDYIYPTSTAGQPMADFARLSQAQMRHAAVYQRVQQWASSASPSTLGSEQADVDLDGLDEYLLYNARLFALFEARGGRMTAAWLRNSTGQLWQVAGNFAAYNNAEDEWEGPDNAQAYRTSGFKDWWVVTGGNGSSAAVNATNTVSSSPSGTGWVFSNAVNGITKIITLDSATTNALRAAYTLSGPQALYVRFGLSPDVMTLKKKGQSVLSSGMNGGRMEVVNNGGSEVITAWVEAPVISTGAIDTTNVSPTTVNMRNLAQTEQVEAELSGGSSFTVTLGFAAGTSEEPPAVNDGVPVDWLTGYGYAADVNVTNTMAANGINNLKEAYIAGLDPTDANSNLEISIFGMQTNGFTISFGTVTGRLYSVEFKNALMTGDWSLVGSWLAGQTNPVSGDGTTKSVTDTEATTRTNRFYRFKVELE